jgi:hypothetical protein
MRPREALDVPAFLGWRLSFACGTNYFFFSFHTKASSGTRTLVSLTISVCSWLSFFRAPLKALIVL